MTREEILQEVLQIPNKNKLLMLGTGVGKTRIALELLNQINPTGKILIVIPRLVLIQNWKDEFIKWGYEKYLPQVEFITYVSLPKKAGEQYVLKILDEAHHLSERCLQAVPYIKSEYNILLSATIKSTLIPVLKNIFSDLYMYRISLSTAIENEILPEPKIILIPFILNNTTPTEIYRVKPKEEDRKTITYQQWLKGKWKYLRGQYKFGVDIICTQQQKYNEIQGYMDSINKKSNKSKKDVLTLKQLGRERLQMLAEIKSDFVKQLLKYLKNYRTLTFCYDIKQTKELGKYCINSQNKRATEYLDMFNQKKIKHITACNQLNEGVNLTDCKYGIFVNYNVSEICYLQKQGRLLRHKEPVFLLPFYRNTKEQDIIADMIRDYDKSLITIVSNPFNFNEYINR